MVLVFLVFAMVWGIGWAMGAAVRQRFAAVAGLWVLVVLALLMLPEGSLRAALGGDLRGWLLLGGVVALIWAYRAGLGWLRARALPPVTPEAAAFSEAELGRYARHLLLREIGGPGQQRLKQARVLVIGAGGLGSPICLYLAASGVGTIGVVDPDRIESSNLQRQIIHRDAGIGGSKAHSAAAAMRALNPFMSVQVHEQRLVAGNAEALIGAHDLVLDGSDNFDTRYLVNATCVALRKPLISGAMTQWEGQLSLYAPHLGSPCYQCVFPDRPAPGMVPACAEAGVAAPLPGVMGAMMAMEAVKHLTGAGQSLAGRLVLHDALHAEHRVIKVKPRPDCPICGQKHSENT